MIKNTADMTSYVFLQIFYTKIATWYILNTLPNLNSVQILKRDFRL